MIEPEQKTYMSVVIMTGHFYPILGSLAGWLAETGPKPMPLIAQAGCFFCMPLLFMSVHLFLLNIFMLPTEFIAMKHEKQFRSVMLYLTFILSLVVCFGRLSRHLWR